MSKRFEGKTALITGGASGIGKTTAQQFAAEGANIVIITSTIVDKAVSLAEELKQTYGVGAIGLKCDVRVEADVKAAMETAVATFGQIDYAFNNAGVGPDGKTIPMAMLTDVTEKDWDWVIDVDLKGVFLCMKYEMRYMKERGFGVIINTASTAGMKAMPGFGAYGPAKAGLIMLSKAATVELQGTGVRVNVVCPGPTLGTGMADRLFGKEEDIVPGAPGQPPKFNKTKDVADIVLAVCSDECRNINGNVITADGGMDVI